MIKAIIFDCFGVLYKDPELDILQARQTHTTPEHDQLTIDFDLGRVDQNRKFQSLADLIHDDVATVSARMQDLSGLNYTLLGLVQALKPHYKLGMLSNINNNFLQSFLKYQNLGNYFDVVMTSEDAGVLKPDPRIFELVLERLKVEAGEAVFIDDRQENVEGAEALGITSLLYTNHAQLKTDLKKLDLNGL